MRIVVNRLLALIVGLAVIALAVVVIAEVVAKLVGADPVLVDWPAAYAWAQRTTWGDIAVMGVSLLLALIGLALVIGQLWPSKVRRLAVDSPDPATDASITRRGLVRDVTAAVSEVDGVRPQRVIVGRRRIRVRAAAGSTDSDPAALSDAVTSSVRRRLDRLHLRRPPQLAVNISRRP
ncbi:hypothetical protein Rhe02_11660 [Rhizocola hellebori]|uniref:DUF6286 domain-containing protein n=1 Tax=Rhizocola hellebori TaxID=1392758 RepID=A0A8J3VD10_9ACTN|nr:DUF6286 domain-containing protein [Rhizocola hellebori]GIH03099.1 hypothetical protein Rhe02_11660 [Rhizocola hellebori]